MTKPRLKLRPQVRQVWSQGSPLRPLAALSMAEKRANAIAWLRERKRYILDQDARRPAWGIPGTPAKERK